MTIDMPSFDRHQPGRVAWPDIRPGSAEDVPLLAEALGDPVLALAPLIELARASFRVVCGVGALSLASPCDPVPSWWLVRSGRVSLGERGDQGQFVEHAALRRGDWLDVAGAASPQRAWLREAVVRADAELIALPLEALAKACAHDPALAMALMRITGTQLRSMRDRLWQVCTASVTARVARWLLQEAGGHDAACREGPSVWTLSEPKQTVAQHLHMTPESLSRSLRQLCDEKLIAVRGYRVTLLDEAELRRRVETGDGWPRRAERRGSRKAEARAGA